MLPESSLWTLAFKPRPDAVARLFCFPYAGAGGTVFRPWPDALGTSVELRALQLPGRGARLREPRVSSMPTLLAALVPAVEALCDRPYVLFGHSLGALVAYETARELSRRGRAPACLLVSGQIAPHLPSPHPPLHRLGDAEFVTALRTLNGIPQAVLAEPDLLQLLLPTVRSDFCLLETYQHVPGAALRCPIVVLGAAEDPRTNQTGLERWRELTEASCQCRLLTGGHFFIETARAAVLGIVSQALSEAVPARVGERPTAR